MSWSWPRLLLGSRYTNTMVFAASQAKEFLWILLHLSCYRESHGEADSSYGLSLQKKTESNKSTRACPHTGCHVGTPGLPPLRIWDLGHQQRQPVAWANTSSSRGIHTRIGLNVMTLRWCPYSTSSFKHTKQAERARLLLGLVLGQSQQIVPRPQGCCSCWAFFQQALLKAWGFSFIVQLSLC